MSAVIEAPAEVPSIGPRVRALREAEGMSLRELAQRTGVSPPMLSQVERAETSPTVALAGRIASGLDLTLSQLLRLDESDGVTVVRAADRLMGGTADRGHRYEVLTPPIPGQRAEVSVHTLNPGSSTGAPDDPPIHEPGSRETAVVDEGTVLLVCAGVEHHLGPGDAVTFDADLPHHFHNPGSSDARLLSVVAAGLRRS
jgi:transcriptional regulator with XRE-family HTH domain